MNTIRFSKKAVLTSLSIRMDQERLCLSESKELWTPSQDSEGRLEALIEVYRDLSGRNFTKASLGDYIAKELSELVTRYHIDTRDGTNQIKNSSHSQKVGYWTYRSYREVQNSWDLGYKF